VEIDHASTLLARRRGDYSAFFPERCEAMNSTETKLVATGLNVVAGLAKSAIGEIIEHRADNGSRVCQSLECLGTTKSPVHVDGERRSHELSDRPLLDMMGSVLEIWSK
jgi:hypothetical protein